MIRKARHEAQLLLIGFVVLIWTLLPIYNMVLLAFTPRREAMGIVMPKNPTFDNFAAVLTQDHYFLKYFWQQLLNSVICALVGCALVLLIATCGSYAVSRLRTPAGPAVINTALLSYLIPNAFLAIPIYMTMSSYGMLDTRTALILATVAFTAPYAIWILMQQSNSLPIELDEAAKVDGASPWQIFYMIYLPLMVPALIAVGTQAIVMSWNEYLFALLILSSPERATIPLALGLFLGIDDPPWTILMAMAILYSIPPIALYYGVRRYMVSGVTAGAVKT
jgi:multiple sugar transport system permease protein